MIRRPPRSTLFPSTTLSQSAVNDVVGVPAAPLVQASIDCTTPTTVHISWSTPDDHGSTILRYNIRSEEHTSELQSQSNLVCRLLLEKKKNSHDRHYTYE